MRRDPARTMMLRIWAIGAVVPLVYYWRSGFGRYDFAAFWIAGRQVLSGDVASIYIASVAQQIADKFSYGMGSVFPYPPHALFFFIPFALLPYLLGYAVWNFLTAAFFWWAVRSYLPKGFPSILAVLSPAALFCMSFGQTGLLFGGLWLLAFRGKWAAVALLTFKPHLGVLSVLSLHRRSDILRVCALALTLVAASAIMFGPTLWSAFADHTLLHAGLVAEKVRWKFIGVTPAIAYGFWGWIPFAAGGALLLARKVNAFTAATASLLISPYGFHYDMPVACLGFGILLYANWMTMPLKHRLPIALGFMSPVIALTGVWWVCPILFWALWAQIQYDVILPAAGNAN